MVIYTNKRNTCLAKRIVRALGGVSVLAKLLGKSKAAVSLWQVRGLPNNYLVRNEIVGHLKAKLVNPDPLIKELTDG